MVDVAEVGLVRRVRRWRSVSEKRQIVQLTMEPGASVAEVARAHGVNANQVFKWRRTFERGELDASCTALLPVRVSTAAQIEGEAAEQPSQAQAVTGGAIHIEFAGRAVISVERGADPVLVRSILESFAK
jgi:transposase